MERRALKTATLWRIAAEWQDPPARRRRAAEAAALLAPTLWMLAGDLIRRPRHIVGFGPVHALSYAASMVESAFVWGLLLYAASRRRGSLRWISAALFTAGYGLAAGVQGAFHRLFNIYLSVDGTLTSESLPWALVGTLPMHRRAVPFHLALGAGAAIAFLLLARRVVRPRQSFVRHASGLAPAALLVAAYVPVSYRAVQSTLPDMIYFHGLGALVHRKVLDRKPPLVVTQRRTPLPVPFARAAPARPRNVLLVLQEALRADATCIAYEPQCQKANRATNALFPNRLPLLQLRANAASTAVSTAVLWSGRSPLGGREDLLSAPLLWEYARAAGYDAAYWTSQHLMFGNARLYVQDLPISRFCSATDLDPEAHWLGGADDALLTERVIREWGELREPFFAVVHYSNIHVPRVYDPDRAPFQPSTKVKSPVRSDEATVNYYYNVAYLSDLAVGRLLDHVKNSPSGPRTVIVYTSDHGEPFDEHGAEREHGGSVYEEEIRVPGWIDAPFGTLAPEEVANLSGARTQLVFHLDFAPTLLDLMGLWDAPALAPFRRGMPGLPLTRPERTKGAVPLTNVSWVWEYYRHNWGIMRGTMKAVALHKDARFRCFDVMADPEEQNDLGEAGCGDLPKLGRRLYRGMPAGSPRLLAWPEWADR